ncbi:NBR1-Ig-like domain-containing protein [Amycolatopsis benzoatilytica]|uniref:NBR1-Ig-like domain-containing protein n=1 Tax=Amycolatopsis benzoatilytica TaxID=346045 RepID=UPI0003A7244A|nr:NBR1-Ig-like domain-containing protein [Amycolatopsis benzoatilytica]
MSDGRTPAAVLSAELAELRLRAGNPSFRKMAERSGRISHTTLHEAVGGTRFPSWDTTREFVRACEGDEEQWRRRWEELKGVPPAAPPQPIESIEPLADVPVEHADREGSAVGVAPEPAAPRRPRRKHALAVIAFVVVLLAGTAAVILPKLRSGSVVDVGARIPGDNSKFIADVTYPDGSQIRVGETVQKVWELQNTGSVPWHERYLLRMDRPAAPGACRTPDRVLIGDTPPGDHVMVSVSVTAPAKPGRCWVGWKMVDASGAEFFQTRRPVYLLVTVVS